MNSPFPFEPLIVFGFLSAMLLVGVLLRAKSVVIQRYLFPSCLVGGVVGMALVNTGLIPIKTNLIETFAYHLFNLSFISIGLTGEAKKEEAPAGEGREVLKGSLWMGLAQGISFPLQALIGGLTVIAFGLAGKSIFQTFGFLCPLGFNEGPGQALSFGKVWEESGFAGGATVGLAFAAIGFLFAFFVGVPLANWGLRRGMSAHGKAELPKSFITGVMGKDEKHESAGRLTLHSANIDTLAFQFALVGAVYLLSYLFVSQVSSMLGPEDAKIVWGFLFIIGLAFGLLVKKGLDLIGAGRLVDPGIQRRITGWSVDYLIVATASAIQFMVVWKYFFPLATISLISGVATTAMVVYLSRRASSYQLERGLAFYGMVTGTVSSGLLLLRIVDPEFKTPVALELGLMSIFAIPIIFLCLLLVNAPLTSGTPMWEVLGLFAVMLSVCFVLLRALKL